MTSPRRILRAVLLYSAILTGNLVGKIVNMFAPNWLVTTFMRFRKMKEEDREKAESSVKYLISTLFLKKKLHNIWRDLTKEAEEGEL